MQSSAEAFVTTLSRAQQRMLWLHKLAAPARSALVALVSQRRGEEGRPRMGGIDPTWEDIARAGSD